MQNYAIEFAEANNYKAIRIDVNEVNEPAKKNISFRWFEFIEQVQLCYEDTG
ncbi:hypothetical protein ACF3NG_07555 [Aerococcaceae bacterium WGS1372]